MTSARRPVLALIVLLPAVIHGQSSGLRAGAAGGIRWTVPAGWTEQKATAMRVATYQVPGAGAESAGECAVFFFGPGQGGSVDANLERWARQFEGSPSRSARSAASTGCP